MKHFAEIWLIKIQKNYFEIFTIVEIYSRQKSEPKEL